MRPVMLRSLMATIGALVVSLLVSPYDQFIFRAPAPAGAYYTGTLRNPSASTTTAIQTSIDAASDGDIVRMSSSSCTITGSTITISGKGILFDMNGCSYSGRLSITSDASHSVKVMNGTFTHAATCFSPNAPTISVGGSATDALWVLANLTHSGSGSCRIRTNDSFGLIYGLSIPDADATEEIIHHEYGGCGSGSSYSLCGWDQDVTPGTDRQVYVEDSTLTCAGGCSNPAWQQSYYGARVVNRFSTFNYVMIDNHGTAGNVGGRWWESYKNVWNLNGGTNAGRGTHNLRAGSGLVWGNTKSSGSISGVGLCEEDSSSYPAAYQIGRGTSGALTPAYIFDNGTMTVGGCTDASNNGTVTNNTDYYTSIGASCTAGGSCTTGVGSGTSLPTTCTAGVGFWKTDEGEWWAANAGTDGVLYKCTATNTWTLYWTPYTYPHPLQTTREADK